MADQEYYILLDHANNWRYLMLLASENMTKDQLWQHNKATTKGDLDAWLMQRFGLDAGEARNISNYSMDNIDYHVSQEGIWWLAKRQPPTWEQYPELLAQVNERMTT